MAYRFLLEVPESLASDANVAVASAGDAQVLVDRNSHGLGFDDPYNNLTVAAHTLRVVDTLYGWADDIGATKPETRFKVGIVLHSGERIGLHEIDRPGMIASIRRDQPWVERSVPKIGEHESAYYRPPVGGSQDGSSSAIQAIEGSDGTILGVDLIEAEDELIVNGRTFAVVQVGDLPPAERFYTSLFGLEIQQRMRQAEQGVWIELPPTYDQMTAAQTGEVADVVFMINEPLHLAVVRAGRSARLDYAQVHNAIEIGMTAEGADRLKAQVLMRSYTLLASAGPAFSFRDPYGVVWNVRPVS
jgi:uncharacterized glyoxalase superfamily protein PhnB